MCVCVCVCRAELSRAKINVNDEGYVGFLGEFELDGPVSSGSPGRIITPKRGIIEVVRGKYSPVERATIECAARTMRGRGHECVFRRWPRLDRETEKKSRSVSARLEPIESRQLPKRSAKLPRAI